MNKKVISVILAAMLILPALASCGKDKIGEGDASTDVNVTEQEKVTPTFMYFVSNSDEDFDEAQSVVEELQKEYDGKVIFNVINIDENTEAASNFPVQGQTPMLIMLNTSNDISAMNPKCSDKEKLKAAIDAAIGE